MLAFVGMGAVDPTTLFDIAMLAPSSPRLLKLLDGEQLAAQRAILTAPVRNNSDAVAHGITSMHKGRKPLWGRLSPSSALWALRHLSGAASGRPNFQLARSVTMSEVTSA